MPGSVTSVFSEPDDFQAALREDGVLSLLITGHGQFRARLTQVTLHRWRLWTSEEHLSRIGFVAVPANAILVLLPISSRVASICGGIGMRAGDIMMLGCGLQVQTRTDGPCRWASLRLPAQEIARYGRALIGAGFAVPATAQLWRLHARLSGSCATSMRPPSERLRYGPEYLLASRQRMGWSSN
jgi:hypothetical protein